MRNQAGQQNMYSDNMLGTNEENPKASLTDSSLESLLDSRSLEQTWSFLDLPSSASTVDEESNQSSVAVQSQQAQCRHLYRELKLVKQVGEGAVFQVGLYLHSDGRRFAVKHVKLGGKLRDGGNNPAGGIFSALREIQVNFHEALKRHENIVEIMGWDWSEKRVPVILTEYAENGTLREFVHRHCSDTKAQPWYELKRNFALDIASGLCALHASDVAHGDVKLENTLVFPHPERGWHAKVSDFSHAVFGISTKRKSTYPGSGLYNAPEIRRRSAVITSDLLPRCETFSYGLLLWELVKDGQSFFDMKWMHMHSDAQPLSPTLEGSRIACLERLPPDALLDRALAFLGTCSTIPASGRSLFALVFEQTLKDRSPRRSDMSTIAAMLDQQDRATIYYHSSTPSVVSVPVWNFSPWSKAVPWTTQIQTVQEFERLSDDFVQPNHAEWYLLLSRCYAEGFGVKIDYQKVIENLQKAAQHESVEAAFILLLIEDHFPVSTLSTKQTVPRGPILVDGAPIFEEPVKIAMQAVHKAGTLVSQDLKYISMIQAWNEQNCSHIRRRAFQFQGNTYFWTRTHDTERFFADINASQFSIWYIIITFESLESTLQTEDFFSACASIGASLWWKSAMDFASNVQKISQEELEIVIHNSLLAAMRNGHSNVCTTILGWLGPKHRKGFASRVTSQRAKTPLHFLAFVKADEGRLEELASELSHIGFDLLVNHAVYNRTWLPPLGIELHGTPLHMAVRLRSLPAVKALIGIGAKPIEVSAVDPRSPLELAICLHLSEIVDYIFRNCPMGGVSPRAFITTLGTTSPKGIFDMWLLHTASAEWPNGLEASHSRLLSMVQKSFGIFSDAETKDILLRSLCSGWKSATTFKSLTNHLMLSQGCNTLSYNDIAEVLDVIEQIISDDPVNRELLQSLFSASSLNINWPNFLKEYQYDSDTGPRTENLLFRWASQGMGFNLSDLRFAMSPKDWKYVVKLPNTMGRLPIDAAILSGCLITFDLLARHYQPTECLRRAIDHCATDVAAHIIRSDSGTIFCDERESDQPPCRTALHYATATSNTAMIRFLIALRVSWTNKHIQHLMTKTNSIRRNHTLDLQLYRWDPIFNMLDLNDMNRTALEIAADRNDKKSIEALLQQERDDSGTADISQDILSIVVKSGRANIVKTLLHRWESPYCNLPLSTGSLIPNTNSESTSFSSLPKWNFIFHATFHATSGELQLNALEQLLALCKDKDIGTIDGVDSKHFWNNDRLWNGWLPIHYAVYCGQLGVIRAFIAAEIWSPDEMTGMLTQYPSFNLETEMPKWYLAFRYDSLFTRISSKALAVADPYPSTKEAISEKGKKFRTVVSAAAKGVMNSIVGSNQEVDRTGTSSTANSVDGEYIPTSLYRYKYYHLWGRRSSLDMGHDDHTAHDLIWSLRDCLTMARDLVNLNDHVRVPDFSTRQRQTRLIYKESREDIILELQKWKNQQLKRTIADGAMEVLDIEKNVRRVLNEVDDATRAGNVLARGEATVTVGPAGSPALE